MKQYWGNHLGICINNADPEKRGRVQIFIPHIMPALFNEWNAEGKDITIKCVGDNIPDGLSSSIVERLIKILPWAEAASPIVGMSAPGAVTSGSSVGEAIAAQSGGEGGADSFAGGNMGAATGEGGGAEQGTVLDQSPTTSDAVPPPPTTTGGPLKFSDMANEGRGPKTMPGGRNGNWGGSANVLSDLLPDGFNYQPSSTKRKYPPPPKADYSNNPNSDHNWDWQDAYAVDLAARTFGSNLTTRGSEAYNKATQCAIAIYNNIRAQIGRPALPMNTPWTPQLAAEAMVKYTLPNGYRTQLMWWTKDGYHNNHIHFGVKYVGPTKENIAESAKPPPRAPASSKDGGLKANDKVVPANNAAGAPSSPKAFGMGDAPAPAGSTLQSLGGAPSPPQQPQGSPFGPHKGKIIVSATGVNGSGRTTVTYADGTSATFNQPRPVRNNNPGNLEFGSFARSHGAVGSDGRYAVFPTVQSGYRAKIALLKLPRYQVLSIADAFERYAPRSENPNYQRDLQAYTGFDMSRKMSSLSVDEFDTLVAGVSKIEGFRGAQDLPKASQMGLDQPLDPAAMAAAEAAAMANGSMGAAEAAAMGSPDTSLMNRTSDHGPLTVKNTNDTPNGLFAYPAVGAMLWVFFREGNPLFPVYFAASFGADEWSGAYRQGSAAPGIAYNGEGPGGGFSHGTEFKPTPAGGISSTYTVNPLDPSKDQKTIMMYADDGSNILLASGYNQYFSQHDRVDYVAEDRFNTTMGYKEQWVQGDSNTVIIGDCYIKIGDVSQRAVDAMEQIKKYTAEIQEPLLQSNASGGGGGGGGSSAPASTTPADPTKTALPPKLQQAIDNRSILNRLAPEPNKPWVKNPQPASGSGGVSYTETQITTIKKTGYPVVF